MTTILCYEDSYIREFDATVTDITSKGVVLDSTAFYPGGGGQPADSGMLSSGDAYYAVKKLSRQSGKLVHEIDGELPAVGASVHGTLDWDRRYLLMRTHTALHILCGVVWRDYGAQVTGGNMQPGSARMDFELENMSVDFAERMETLVNEEVQAARPIEVATLPREEAFSIPDLIRTKINLLPPAITEVRTVNITGLDLQADGGTHVANTGEVGIIKVVGHESKGRINKRLRIRLDA
ncbi:MAG: alanyl-tRNA editing protein [Chloroflexota bacterium]|nr:alanyl-tRNA editing protein [Chloroflexota bacterium]